MLYLGKENVSAYAIATLIKGSFEILALLWGRSASHVPHIITLVLNDFMEKHMVLH